MDQMRRVFTETLSRQRAIHGVIHAAGIVHDGLIEGKTREVAEAVLAPKLRACGVLHQLAKDAGSEFLVLFSSTASVLGPLGQVDYSAANACLDAFSHFAQSQTGGPRTVAINWPAWREVGILAEMEPAPGMQQWKEKALRRAISTEDGLEVFRRALDSDLPQVIVSPQDLNALLHDNPGVLTGMPATSARTGSSAQAAELSLWNGGDVEGVIARIWSEVLGMTGIPRNESLFNLGGHSLLAMQIVARLRAAYQVEITLRDFFEAPTIAQLSAVIQGKLMQDIESLSDEQVRELIAKEAAANG
jgi:NAD(P)-dependent dehydrogenase (short-subunit alcohol dehydrogenase family)/acyl carrier protein